MADNNQSSMARRADNTQTEPTAVAQLAPVEVEFFDEYVLIGKLGHGGMAEVFLALSHGPSNFRKLLVIKRMHGHMKDDAQVVNMFLDEARLAARLNHPNVVQTNKVGSYQGHHFLAMEFLDGQPLNRVLKRAKERQSNLPVPVAVRVASDALDGLHYAHEAKDFDGTPMMIVHRDISPHNIFVTYDGQVKILDFGIAKAAIQESMTRTGLIKGKFAYIAPEQAKGDVVDRRADIWSMGITVWETLAGRRLFRGANEVALLHATLNDEIPLLSDVVPGVPVELARIVDKALQRDREKRYDTALDFKEALDEWMASQSKSSGRSSLSNLMKELFEDTLTEQRAMIKQCLARVGSQTGGFNSISQVMPVGPQASLATASHTGAHPEDFALKSDSRSGISSASVAAGAFAPVSIAPEKSWGERHGWKLGLAAALLALLLVVVAVAPTLMGGGSQPIAENAHTEDGAHTEIATPPPVVVVTPPPIVVPPSTPVAPETVAPETVQAVAPAATEPPPASDATEQVEEEEEPSGHSTGRRPRGRQQVRANPPPQQPQAVAPPPAPTPPQPAAQREPEPPAAPAPGRLQLDSTPYAIVSLGSRRLGITPIDVELPAGRHTLTLRNPEQGLETTYSVTIPPGGSVNRRVALE